MCVLRDLNFYLEEIPGLLYLTMIEGVFRSDRERFFSLSAMAVIELPFMRREFIRILIYQFLPEYLDTHLRPFAMHLLCSVVQDSMDMIHFLGVSCYDADFSHLDFTAGTAGRFFRSHLA